MIFLNLIFTNASPGELNLPTASKQWACGVLIMKSVCLKLMLFDLRHLNKRKYFCLHIYPIFHLIMIEKDQIPN